LTDTLKTAKDTIKGQSGIYAFQCLETGAYYIGSSGDLYNRFYDHLMNYSSNLHLQRAIALYGLPSFVFFVVELCAKDQLLAREQHWLDWLFRLPASLRYNFSLIAGAPMAGRTHTEETKAKISALKSGESSSMFGKNHSEESKDLIRKAKQGERHPMFSR
jgi:group I intron endonuclease